MRELTSFKLATIAPGATLFDALALMIQHQVHCLVVFAGDQPVGMLEQLNLSCRVTLTCSRWRSSRRKILTRCAPEKITRFGLAVPRRHPGQPDVETANGPVTRDKLAKEGSLPASKDCYRRHLEHFRRAGIPSAQ